MLAMYQLKSSLLKSSKQGDTLSTIKMAGDMIRVTLGTVFVLVALLSLVQLGEANYKNAPMNGIMFGKRGPAVTAEYDNRGKTFTALCEIATEACQAWFPSPENK